MKTIHKTFNFDFKNWIIFVLIGLLIISFFLGKGKKIDNHKDEITKLHKINDSLLKRVDNLKLANSSLDLLLKNIDGKLKENNYRIDKSIFILNELKKKENEIPNYVNTLSANGTADAFSEYLNKRERTESNNNNK